MTAEPMRDPAGEGSPGGREGALRGERPSCRVELFGLARQIVGQKVLAVDLPPAARVADVLARLAADHPGLVGGVLRPDARGIGEGYVLNLNGREFVEDAETAVCPGDTLLILANTAGG